MRKVALALAVAAALSIAAPVEAALVVTDFSFTGPVASGTFTLSCSDPAFGTCSVASFNTVIGATTFTAANTGVEAGGLFLRLGGTPNGVGGFATGPGSPDDFSFIFEPLGTFPQTVSLTYVLAGASNLAFGDITISHVSGGAVPEPATWAMMLIGFGAIGFAMRRRKVAETLHA